MRENISDRESFSHCIFTDFDDITLYSSHAFYDNIFAVARIVIIFTRNQGYLLTHLLIVPHICVNESGQHWFK